MYQKFFAHKMKGANSRTQFMHIFPSKVQVEMCGPFEIFAVKVRESRMDEFGFYWGWVDTGKTRFEMIQSALILLEMCFPQGAKQAEKDGRGKIVNLVVELDE